MHKRTSLLLQRIQQHNSKVTAEAAQRAYDPAVIAASQQYTGPRYLAAVCHTQDQAITGFTNTMPPSLVPAVELVGVISEPSKVPIEHIEALIQQQATRLTTSEVTVECRLSTGTDIRGPGVAAGLRAYNYIVRTKQEGTGAAVLDLLEQAPKLKLYVRAQDRITAEPRPPEMRLWQANPGQDAEIGRTAQCVVTYADTSSYGLTSQQHGQRSLDYAKAA